MNKYLSGGDVKQVKKIADKAVGRHEKEMHGSRGIGLLKPGSEKKLAKGGVTNMQRRELGRGLAKVANQKKSSFTYRKMGGK
jgi:hypothetical protein